MSEESQLPSGRPRLVRTAWQLVRFGGVGVAINVVLYLIYLGIVGLGADPKVAFTLTFLMGTPLSFYSHYRVSFLAEGAGGLPAFVRFLVIHFSGYFLNLGGLYLLVDVAGLPHAPVQAGMVLCVAAFGFVTQKLWVFGV